MRTAKSKRAARSLAAILSLFSDHSSALSAQREMRLHLSSLSGPRQSNAEQIKMMERWFFTLEGRKYDKARGDWRRSWSDINSARSSAQFFAGCPSLPTLVDFVHTPARACCRASSDGMGAWAASSSAAWRSRPLRAG